MVTSTKPVSDKGCFPAPMPTIVPILPESVERPVAFISVFPVPQIPHLFQNLPPPEGEVESAFLGLLETLGGIGESHVLRDIGKFSGLCPLRPFRKDFFVELGPITMDLALPLEFPNDHLLACLFDDKDELSAVDFVGAKAILLHELLEFVFEIL